MNQKRFPSPESTRGFCVRQRPLLNLTVLSFFSQFPGSALVPPSIPSGTRSAVRLDPGLSAQVFPRRGQGQAAPSPEAQAARRDPQADSPQPPRLAWEGWPLAATSCPLGAETCRLRGFKGQLPLGTEQSRPGSERGQGGFTGVCVQRQVCGTDVRGMGRGGPRRQGIEAGRGSSRTLQGLGIPLNSRCVPGGRRWSALPPGSPPLPGVRTMNSALWICRAV